MTQGKNIRLLAVDMDGTCLNSRSQMTAETIRAGSGGEGRNHCSADDGTEFVLSPAQTGGETEYLQICDQLQRGFGGRLQRKEGMDADFDSKGAGTAPGQSLQRKI